MIRFRMFQWRSGLIPAAIFHDGDCAAFQEALMKRNLGLMMLVAISVLTVLLRRLAIREPGHR